MGKYAKEELLASLNIAEKMLVCSVDKYSIAYWLCMYWMFIAALNTEKGYFNPLTAEACWGIAFIGMYRNYYAHANTDLFIMFDRLLENITVRMENYDACTKAASDRLYSLA